MKGKRIAIALSLAALFTAAACPRKPSKPAGDGGAGRARDQLVVHLEVEPAHLVYMLKPDAWAYRMTAHTLLQALIRIDPKSYGFVGELAREWTVSDDGLTYTFDLRRDVRWHDGKPFSGADVKFTFDRLMDENVQAASTRASLEPFIDRYELVGEHTFKIVCKEPSFFFLQNLASVMILPAHLMRQGDLNRHPLLRRPIGTGPYRFSSWTPGREIVLERYDRYWGKAPRIRRLVWRIVRDAAVALRLARRGELGFVPRVGPDLWTSQVLRDAAFRKRFAFTYHTTPGIGFVLFNHQRPLLADVRVRRALGELLDVDMIVKKIMYGLAERVPSLYWANDPYFDSTIKALRFDPTAAAATLEQAGFRDQDADGVLERGGKPLSFTFIVSAGSKSAQRWLTIYQQQLRKARVKMEIQTLEWAAYLQRIREHDYDLAALGMQISGPYTDLYLQLHSSQIKEGQNYAAFSDPEVDRLLERIRVERDHARRKQLTHALQQRLAEKVPVLPLFSLREPGLVAREVRGVYSSDMWYQLQDWWIE